jgi:hypothetical protein
MSDTKRIVFDTVRSVGHPRLYPPDEPNAIDINTFRDIYRHRSGTTTQPHRSGSGGQKQRTGVSTGFDFAVFSRIAQGDGAREDRRRNP